MQLILIEAIYENGVLKLDQPLPLAEKERVHVSIHAATPQRGSVSMSDDPVRTSYGMLGWKGDAETAERLALDPEFGVEESP